MRRITQLSVLVFAAGVVSACSPDEIIKTEDIPSAGVRFINAVPDTIAMDFRFVDMVESNAHFRHAYRSNPVTSGGVTASTQIQYKQARAGSRSYKIFLNDTLQSVASTVMNQGTMTLEAGKNYTVIIWGYANPTGPGRPAGAPAMKVDVWEEAVADPGANVALRVINATGAAIDGRQYVSTGTAPATATWANVAPLTRSAFVTVAPAQIRYNIRAAGGAAALFADPLALIGAPATSSGTACGAAGQPPCDIPAAPGTTIAGSAVTAIVFPASVAPARAFATSGAMFIWDRRPPTGCAPNLC